MLDLASSVSPLLISSIALSRGVDAGLDGTHFCIYGNANGKNALSLVDNGSQATLVNHAFVASMGASSRLLPNPIPLYNAGGELHSTISRVATMRFVLTDANGKKHSELLRAYVTNLPYYDIILGDPWLVLHNPHVDWEQRTLTFDKCAARGCTVHNSLCLKAADPQSKSRARSSILPPDRHDDSNNPIEVKQLSALSFMKELGDPSNVFSLLLPTHSLLSPEELQRQDRESLNLRLSALATMPSKFSESDFEKHMKGPTVYSPDELNARIPAAYADLAQVFHRSAADTLAPHRPGVDHEIHLIPGSEGKLPHVRNYWSLSPREQEAVAKYILENKRKGFIRPSTSPVAAPVLVVKKPGGGLRVCVDYRALNNITIKSRYPIPLISETLNNLAKATIFSKFDIIHAFNRIRIAAGYEYLTAFNTRFGQFEYLVLPFGLCNGPATFQQFINTTLQDYLDRYVTAYLDDILVYSSNAHDHVTHVRSVLQRLLDANLQLDIDKSSFHVNEVKYLGLIIGTDGVRMDPDKLRAIREWQPPRSVSDVMAWLGFCGFYRQFIPNYSKLVSSFYDFTKGKVALSKTGKRVMRYPPFQWTQDNTKAFEAVKAAFEAAPVLAHYDPSKETVLETDASDFMTSGVLSQYHGTTLRPVAFFSKKMNGAQWNYAIYDKELLAIVRCLEEWRPELMGLAESFLVKTDHQALEHFMVNKKLTARQARWAEFLSAFNFKIAYNPGKANALADCLTRRSQDTSSPPPKAGRFETVLKPDKLDERLRQSLSSLHLNQISVDPLVNHMDRDLHCAFAALSSNVTSIQELSPTTLHVYATFTPHQSSDDIRMLINGDEVAESSPSTSLLPSLQDFQTAYESDPILSEAVMCCNRRSRSLPPHVFKTLKVSITDLDTHDGLLFHHNRLMVPDVDSLRLNILDYYHQSRFFGHPGERLLFDLITRCFYWPSLRKDVATYVKACHTCKRCKSSNQPPAGLLQPLSPPDRAWQDITLDLIEDLPRSTKRGRCFQHALVVVDRLTKDRVIEPLTSKTTDEIAEALHKRVFCAFGFPTSIISDRGSAFTSKIIQDYCKQFGISWKCSTAHHPQTDGQSENAIRRIKTFLRSYINYAQTDWPDYLPDAEFAARISINETTGMSPFFALYGFHPHTPGESVIPHFPSTRQNTQPSPSHRARDICEWLSASITWSQDRRSQAANRHRRPHPRYQVGDRVFISAAHFSNDRTSKSLGYKYIGPYPIVRIVDNKAYEVHIPSHLADAGVTSTFHPDKLLPEASKSFPGQRPTPAPPVYLTGFNSEVEPEWEIDEIVDCRRTNAYGTQYRAKFLGDWPEWNSRPPWQPWSDFVNAPQKILDYHARHPDAPPPPAHFS